LCVLLWPSLSFLVVILSTSFVRRIPITLQTGGFILSDYPSETERGIGP
jgi:hypothetical protein